MRTVGDCAGPVEFASDPPVASLRTTDTVKVSVSGILRAEDKTAVVLKHGFQTRAPFLFPIKQLAAFPVYSICRRSSRSLPSSACIVAGQNKDRLTHCIQPFSKTCQSSAGLGHRYRRSPLAQSTVTELCPGATREFGTNLH